jgi:serine/threonine-protein kinase HipA
MVQILRRMAFNVLAANNDDHTKNFSFLMREDGPWELAPAYDITHAYRPDSEWVKAHQMSINGKFDRITRVDARVVAERFNLLADLSPVIDSVRSAVGRWREFAAQAQVAADETRTIEGHLQARATTFRA